MKLSFAVLFLSVLEAHITESKQISQPNVAQEEDSNGGIEKLKALEKNSTVFEERNTTLQSTAYSFKVYTHDDETDDTLPSMSVELDEVVAVCLRSSYNNYHNTSEREFVAQQIESEDIYNIPALGAPPIPYYKRDNVYLYGFMGFTIWFLNCNFCDPDEPTLSLEGEELSESTELSSPPGRADQDWEEHFCSCLVEEGGKEASFEILSRAYDCSIIINDKPALEGNAKLAGEHQTKITFTLPFNHIIEEEERFITETLEDLINNSKHTPESSAVVYSPTVDTLPGTSQVKYHDEQKRGTSFLRHTNTEEEYVFSIFATVVSSSSLPASLDNIDDKFCGMLASGPYSKLKGISGCKVEVEAPSFKAAAY